MNRWIALALTAFISFAVSFTLGYVLIPWLHKLRFGQIILDIGPSWHKKKQGTPTMGGIMFIAGIISSIAVVVVTDKLLGGDLISFGQQMFSGAVKAKLYGGILMAIGFALIGFADDYIKVVKKRNLGLTIMQKSIAQILVITTYLSTLTYWGATYVYVPFYGNVELGLFFWLFSAFVIYCTINAVNFTDGIDGLCASVTASAAVALIIIAVLRNFFGISVLASALLGSLLGYLIWNWHPAKVMMGDTGSMFLGGIIIAISFSLNAPWLILFVGIIYVIEFASDVIQIVYYKISHGKRIFKMAPIHHHFEKSGWSEKKIVYIFTAINLAGGLIGIALIYFGRPV